MTPLIDVVFLLLTFFVLSIVLMVRADVFDINLPDAPGEGGSTTGEFIDVVLNVDGNVRIDGERVDRGRIAPTILRLLEERPDAAVRLAADEESKSGDFIRLGQELWDAGIEGVMIMTSGENPQGEPSSGGGPGAGTNENGPG